jgi:hypothetical protein
MKTSHVVIGALALAAVAVSAAFIVRGGAMQYPDNVMDPPTSKLDAAKAWLTMGPPGGIKNPVYAVIDERSVLDIAAAVRATQESDSVQPEADALPEEPDDGEDDAES